MKAIKRILIFASLNLEFFACNHDQKSNMRQGSGITFEKNDHKLSTLQEHKIGHKIITFSSLTNNNSSINVIKNKNIGNLKKGMSILKKDSPKKLYLKKGSFSFSILLLIIILFEYS